MDLDLGDPQLAVILFSFQPLLLTIFILIVVLLACSALVSGSEIAYFSLDPNDIKILRENDTKANKRLLKLKERPRKLLATILISNNFINIAIILLSNYLLEAILPKSVFDSMARGLNQLLSLVGLGALEIDNTSVVFQFLVTVIGVTFVLVLFGEIAPKIYANVNNIKLAQFMAKPLSVLSSLFAPFSHTMVNWSVKLENRLIKDRSSSIKEDIDHAIELTVRNDKNSEEEVDILKSIVKFSDVTAKQVMCSRLDVIAADITMEYDELMNLIRESGFSRVPVYEEDFDHIKGILYVKDLLSHIDEPADFKWQNLIRTEVLYTPEYKKINELLKDFQSKRMHMAIVVDEFGGSAGIITLEDVMEEVIGEIKDEFDDRDEIEYIQLDDNNYVFDGKAMINDVSRIIGVDVNSFEEIRGDADSLAGLVLERTGALPKTNRVIKSGNYTFKVLSVNKRRIEKIQVTYVK